MLVFVAAVVVGGTGAFFSDTETSTGNTFTAGAIDLKIDNHAWYNGLECAEQVEGPYDYVWEWNGEGQLSDPYLQSLVGEECTGTWELSDLDGHLFFNFDDLKPGDWEEDTISIHVNNNDAWMCAELAVTSNDDNSSTEPELLEDGELLEEEDDEWDGELAEELEFIFWADDGDNVYEDGEYLFLEGTPEDLIEYGYDYYNGEEEGYALTFTIADSYSGVFEGPIPGGEDLFIGKAFCFGELDAYGWDGGVVGENDGDPALDSGFNCSGASTSNISQTDGMTGDLSFFAVQSRNNEDFSCSPLHVD